MCLFPKQFTVRGSQCFKEWSPWCWMVWSDSRPACLPLPFICLPILFICLPVLFICLPGWVLVVGFPAGLSPTSFHICLPGHFCGRVRGWLVSHFLSFVPGRLVSHFLSFVSHFFSACGRVPGWLVSHFLSFVSHFFSFVYHFFSIVSPFFSLVSQAGCLWSGSRLACLPLPFILGACGRVPGRLVSHFLECVSHFFSFVSQAGCLSPTSFPFVCVSLLFICLPGWVLVVGFPGGLSPTSLHLSPTFSPNSLLLSQFFLKTCPPFVSLLVSAHFHWPCNISIHPSPRSVSVGVRPLPGLSLVVSALFRWSCSISCHLSPRSVTAGDATFLFICLRGLSLAVPPFSAGDATFLFICFPGLSLLMSALFCWPCSISVHLSPRPITGSVRPFLLAM